MHPSDLNALHSGIVGSFTVFPTCQNAHVQRYSSLSAWPVAFRWMDLPPGSGRSFAEVEKLLLEKMLLEEDETATTSAILRHDLRTAGWGEVDGGPKEVLFGYSDV